MDFLRASRRFNVQSATSANPFWTSSCLHAASTSNPPLLQIPFGLLPAASTSNPPLLQIPFGLPPCFPPLQRPILRSFSLLLDFLLPPAASTSNPPLFLTPFGLPPCFPPLQRPICRSFSLLLDFLLPSHRFNVQSAALSHSFWTSSRLPAASTSNPPLFLTPFGLPPAFPPLQRPIRRFCKSLLDFFPPSRRFNVQSAASANPFWTSSRLPAASTSNLPLLQIPFGLLPAFPPLQRPIRRSFSLLLDFLRASRRFNVQSAASTHAFVVYEYFINYYLTLILEYFIFLL